jgi:tetrapyrrole methylase family protein / MazG family protein
VSDLPRIHVVGLGPCGPELVTAGTLDLIDAVPNRFLRTARHPSSTVLGDVVTFDHVYESAETIEEVYGSILELLVAAAADHGEILYAVPGSPVVAEHTVELLLADERVEALVNPALSFLDLTWARLGIDPVELGVRLVDGHRFAQEAAGERGPLLVAQCDHPFVLSDIKLSVEEPPDVRVTLLQRLGLPDERIVEVDWSDMDRTVEPDHLTSLYIPSLAEPVAGHVVELDQLMRRLRVDDPWKAAQTHHSLKRFLLEESYEVFEAIDAYDPASGEGADELCSELGDLLYQVVFHSALAAEAGWFSLSDVAAGLHDKLVRRHPHVFDAGDVRAPTVDELVSRWESDKRDELGRRSVMDGIPVALPALARASKVLKKADALADEASGLRTGTSGDAEEPTDEELGLALWSLVERAHAAGIDPEDALRRATDSRIREVRRRESAQGRPPTST